MDDVTQQGPAVLISIGNFVRSIVNHAIGAAIGFEIPEFAVPVIGFAVLLLLILTRKVILVIIAIVFLILILIPMIPATVLVPPSPAPLLDP